MIDTISIEIDTKKYLQRDDFENVAIFKKTEQYENNSIPKCQTDILVKWPEDIEATGAYLPQVRYIDYPNPIKGGGHGRCYRYKITLSAPKFFYGDNISELSEAQFDEFIRLLHSTLIFLALPTDITENDIREALVRRIDFGKNIILPKTASTRLISESLMKAEHRHKSKYSQVQYRNGDLYRENIKERAFIVYDKIAEYCNTKAKLVSDIDKKISELNKNKEVQLIRLEVQIQSTQQLKRELKMLGYGNSNPIKLEDVFSDELAQHTLLKYWERATKNIVPKMNTFSPEYLSELFVGMAQDKSGGPQKVFAKTGFAILSAKCGIGKVKELYCDYFDSGSWSRDKGKLLVEHNNCSTYEEIQKITQALEEMKPINIEEVVNGR